MDDRDGKGPPEPRRALVPIPDAPLAESLEAAGPRQLVYVDGKGRVRSPARFRAVSAVSWAAIGTMVVGTGAFYGVFFGPLAGVVAGAATLAFTTWRLRPHFLLRRATRLIVHDRLDEADALLRKVLATRLIGGARAEALHRLALVAARRGD